MRAFKLLALGGGFTLLCTVAQAERIVTLGGTVTEIVFQLGGGQQVVAIDQSSLYPPESQHLPRVGYYRQTPLEGVAALLPDKVLASENAGPPEVLQRLQALGVAVQQVPDGATVDSLYQRITMIAAQLGVEREGEVLKQTIRNELEQVRTLPAHPLKTAVLMYRGTQFQLSGTGTSAHHLLEWAGLSNIQSARTGYTSLSVEGVAALDPELIVITQASVDALGGVQAFLRLPGMEHTQAVKNKRVVVMDDLLILGIGPRVAQAVQQLKQAAM